MDARFVARLNRFAALMTCGGRQEIVHVANSGRLGELLRPENPMLLAPAPDVTRRKTSYDIALVDLDGVLVSVDARLPNVLLQEAIVAGLLSPFASYTRLDREVSVYGSRLDFALSGGSGKCYVEAKSVTLVEDGVALFPDAPTQRGLKHLRSLVQAAQAGHRAAAVFVIQRPDARALCPNEKADPEFCAGLREASRNGVEVYAYRCSVSRSEIEIAGTVPVWLEE